ncbi:hepatitis A virus cellular receptor 1 homolog isoform X2 [Loxodonta africana]|uniref:hepatitis A virus cellular receptor 1 homolog isoform X2 n=1 Tax=Loxodonta africana TaxID=9785 RepID=UPI0030CAF416
MHPQVVISSLILLLTDAVASYLQVNGVEGQPVTLPCTYSGQLTSMCWGRGKCPNSQCSDEIIWVDESGSQITFRKHRRYKLNGSLLKGDVSLTVDNAVKADSGLYCCRIEHRGWFNDHKLTISLEIKAVFTSSPPTQPAETQPKTPQEKKTLPTSSPWYSYPTGGNFTVTPSTHGLWPDNQTEHPGCTSSKTDLFVLLQVRGIFNILHQHHNSEASILLRSSLFIAQLSHVYEEVFQVQETKMTTAKKLYTGISVSALVLLSLLVVLSINRYLHRKSKLQQLRAVSFNGPKIDALRSAAESPIRAEDNVYIIEEDVYVME